MKAFTLSLILLIFAFSLYAETKDLYPNYDLAPGVIPGDGLTAPTDDMWDLQYEWDAEGITGSNGILGIEFDGENLWISERSVGDPTIYIIEPITGTLVGQIWNLWIDWGIRDMCHDDQYIYGGEDSGLLCLDPVTQTVIMTLTWPAGMSFPRANAYDPATDHFYCGNFGSTCYEMDRQGNLIRSWAPAPLSAVYGMAWDDLAPDGPWLWVMDQTNPSPGCNLHKMDPATLTYTGEYHVLNPPSASNPIAGGVTHVTGLDPQYSSFLNISQSTPDMAASWEGYLFTTPPPLHMVDINLYPVGLPIIIPANGGTIEFNIEIINEDTLDFDVDVWTFVTLPTGDEYGPLINAQDIFMPVGFSGNRERTQVVPANAPAGNYTYDAYTGIYPNLIWGEDHFDFEKTAVADGGRIFTDWSNWGESFDDIDDEAALIVNEFALHNPYPNPFNQRAVLDFVLPSAGETRLVIFDVSGRVVADLVDGGMPAGLNSVKWNASDMPSGIYFARLSYLPGAGTRQHSSVKKLVLLK